ncbi:hypothetical protein AQUCO_02600099v1 [Aquilegia coerulea]|uniref:S-protein homolog n=1 Tax=Aquilegia coerulea TaxID=218851 RepID=A0A2G5D7C3_AQUCA|nr:hypothetical protein AQUCO_02600099v1 [Aquilegia coerulea]
MCSYNKNDHVSSKLVLVLIWFFTIYESFNVSDAALLSKVHVQIHNSILPSMTMNIHCKSKDNDLGNHIILFNEDYEWHFHVNIWGTTLFWCSIGWINEVGHYVHGSFKVYEYKRDNSRCGKRCTWMVQRDGLYFINPSINQAPELMFKWN